MADTQTFAWLLVLLTALVGLVAVVSNRLTAVVKVPVAVLLARGRRGRGEGGASDLHAPSDTVGRADGHDRAVVHPVRRRDGTWDGTGSVRRQAPILVGRRARHVPHRGCGGAAPAAAFGWTGRPVGARGAAVRRPIPRSCSPCSAQREVAGRERHDPGGGVRRERPGRHRVDGEPVRRWVERFRVRSVEWGVPAADGGWWRRRRARWLGPAVVPPPGAAARRGLYPLRTLACALVLFGIATLAAARDTSRCSWRASSFGDRRAPFKREVRRFPGALASLGEIVAFVVLGLTVDVSVLTRANMWVPGLGDRGWRWRS